MNASQDEQDVDTEIGGPPDIGWQAVANCQYICQRRFTAGTLRRMAQAFPVDRRIRLAGHMHRAAQFYQHMGNYRQHRKESYNTAKAICRRRKVSTSWARAG